MTKLANEALRDEKGVVIIVTGVQGLMDALDTEKKANTWKEKEAAEKYIDVKCTAVDNSIKN